MHFYKMPKTHVINSQYWTTFSKRKFMVYLDTAYFAENLLLKTIKKIIFGLLFTLQTLFIYLNALFMFHEQCKRRWSQKKKKKRRQNAKRGRWTWNPNGYLRLISHSPISLVLGSKYQIYPPFPLISAILYHLCLCYCATALFNHAPIKMIRVMHLSHFF